jgi:hypothetical protein
MKKKKVVKRELNMKAIEFDKYLNEHKRVHDEINTKLDSILSVRVNGRIGLQESLQDIYNLVKPLQREQKLKSAWKEYLDNTIFGKVCKTKLGKFLIGSITIFILLAIAHALGAESLDPLKLIVGAFEWILKFI